MAPNDSDQFLATQIRLIQSDSVLRPVAQRFQLPVVETAPLDPQLPLSRAADAPMTLKNLKVTRPAQYLPTADQLPLAQPGPRGGRGQRNRAKLHRAHLRHPLPRRRRPGAFMEKQMEELRAKMERSSAALAQFEKDLSVINPEEKTSILSARLLQLNTEYTSPRPSGCVSRRRSTP